MKNTNVCALPTAHSVTPAVAVTSAHPTLGQVYWAFVDGSDHNAPNCYTLTSHLAEALTLQKGWRNGIMAWMHIDHVARVMTDDTQFAEYFDMDFSEDGAWEAQTVFGGPLKALQERSGQSVEEFTAWLKGASWHDVEIEDVSHAFSVAYVIPELKALKNQHHLCA